MTDQPWSQYDIGEVVKDLFCLRGKRYRTEEEREADIETLSTELKRVQNLKF